MAEDTNITSASSQSDVEASVTSVQDSTSTNQDVQTESDSLQNLNQSSNNEVLDNQQVQESQTDNENNVVPNEVENYQNLFDNIVLNKDKYALNPAFQTCFNEASMALGGNFNAIRFVSLLDNYANSVVKMYEKSKAINDANSKITDKMQFQAGQSKKVTKPLRMQDIKPEELEKYIAQYI